MRKWLVCILALGVAACGDDLTEAIENEEEPDGASRVTHLQESGGVKVTRIDARDEGSWVRLDLETGAEVKADAAWDLAFQRFGVITNGGASGSGGAAVARLATSFDEVERAPAEGYVEDAVDGADDDDYADSAFLGAEPWYAYDPVSHTLAPRQLVFVVRTAEGGHFKVELTGYYDAAGTSGFPTFRWAAVDGPAEPPRIRTLAIDASGREAFVAVNLRDGAVVDVPALESSEAWDIALRRTAIRTNGGTSGPGEAAVAEVEAASLEAIVEVPSGTEFLADAMMPIPGPPGSGEESGNPALATWYDYDPETHAVSPRDAHFVLRTADGSLAKLRIAAWADGHFTIDYALAAPGAERFERDPP